MLLDLFALHLSCFLDPVGAFGGTGTSLKRQSLLGQPAVRLFSCVSSLAWSGCQWLALDNLMVHYIFINAGHSFPRGIQFCDFKDRECGGQQ